MEGPLKTCHFSVVEFQILLSSIKSILLRHGLLTCHLQRSTSGDAHRWISSTLASHWPGHGSCHWKRWCRLTHRPVWQWSGHHSTPHGVPAHGEMEWRQGSCLSPADGGSLGLENNTVENITMLGMFFSFFSLSFSNPDTESHSSCYLWLGHLVVTAPSSMRGQKR